MSSNPNAIDLLDDAIAELEARLNLKPGKIVPTALKTTESSGSSSNKKKNGTKDTKPPAIATDEVPMICKMEFKVGVISKVWVHEKADKLYCEEIDCGEEEPRQIASGLRPHFSLEQMLGQRLLVVSNLKAKNLVGFKSHGMVLCAAAAKPDGSELVEFVEPPEGAPPGEIVTFEGLPPPQPAPPSQVEKKKIFAACAEGMKTTADRVAAWNGHAFMTTAGPCLTKSIADGVLR